MCEYVMDFTHQTRKQRQTKGHTVEDENKKRGNPIGFSYYSPIDSRCIPSGTHSVAGGHPIGQRNWHCALASMVSLPATWLTIYLSSSSFPTFISYTGVIRSGTRVIQNVRKTGKVKKEKRKTVK